MLKLTAILDFNKGSQLKLLTLGVFFPRESKHPLFLLYGTGTTGTRDPWRRGRKQNFGTQTAPCCIAMHLSPHTSQARPFPVCQNLPHKQGKHHHAYMQWLTADWGHTQPSNTLPAAPSTSGSWVYFWDEVSVSLPVLKINSRDGYNTF